MTHLFLVSIHNSLVKAVADLGLCHTMHWWCARNIHSFSEACVGGSLSDCAWLFRKRSHLKFLTFVICVLGLCSRQTSFSIPAITHSAWGNNFVSASSWLLARWDASMWVASQRQLQATTTHSPLWRLCSKVFEARYSVSLAFVFTWARSFFIGVLRMWVPLVIL